MTTRLRAVLVLVATAVAITVVVSAQPRPTPADLRQYYVVQLRGPVLEAWKEALTAGGAEILEYVPDFAFKVRMNPGQANQLQRLSFVASVSPFPASRKVGPRFRRNNAGVYIARVERGASADAVEAAIRATGAQVLRRDDALLTVSADAPQLDRIANIEDVAAIEDVPLRRKHNEFGGGVLMRADLVNDSGFDGSTQTIAIADTGLGNGNAAGAHADIPASRIASMFNWPGLPSTCFDSIADDGAMDVDTGHGTHVATAALGGGAADGVGRGTAPAARLIFQSVENWAMPSFICELLYGIPPGYYLVGIPTDIGQLFQQGYNSGARIHSDSWGSESASAYTADSVNADTFVWAHRDMTITLSAGNSGTDADANGVVDASSINAPATAKNVITVGASENDRQSHWECDATIAGTGCAALGGQNDIFSYGVGFPDRYTVNPLKDDPSAGNAQQLAAFSSRGPTTDGRIKPDVVAPGTWILSGFSDRFQQHYDAAPNPQNGLYQYDGWGFPLNQAYKYMGGTSMAAPLVGGAAAVVRDYYEKARSHSASAALVKATLVNSAVDLLDENNDGINDNANPIPNHHEGWGRVDLLGATSDTKQFVDQAVSLTTSASTTFSYTVTTAGGPFKVTLAWTDYPSSTSATRNLVNDLDLEVIAPDGTAYLGNVFAGGWSATGGSADRVNNLENVFVSTALAGVWIVRVTGFNVPMGPQPFALVVESALEGPGSSLPLVTVSASDSTATEAGLTTGAVTVTRTGDTAAAMTVNFTTSGTATAGADYIALSGSLTIPEGAAAATLLVEPLDDTAVESNETVVVSVAPGAGYDMGFPSSGTVTITSNDLPPDFAIIAMTAPATATAGSSLTVNDTTRNQGTAPAQESQTGFYLSANTLLDGGDHFLGHRDVTALAAGASQAWSTVLTLPATTTAGNYYVLAKADWANAVPETFENNNVRASGQVKVGPDLVSSALTVPVVASTGGSVAISETTRNQGAEAAPASTTSFYLSANNVFEPTDTLFGSRPVPALAVGMSHAASLTLNVPPGMPPGSYYVVAKADGSDAIAETLETNNTRVAGPVRVGPDLTVSSITAPSSAGAGDTIAVNNSVRNGGSDTAGESSATFYLSANTMFEATDVLLGTRPVPSLAAGVTSTVSTTVTVPADTAIGSYFIIAVVDPANAVTEAQETNNVGRSSAVRVGPDLTMFSFSGPTNVVVGATITVSDTTKNGGGGVAAESTTSFYLSANVIFDAGDMLLGSRTVPALAGGVSDIASTELVLPSTFGPATYYLFAVVDSAGVVIETVENNNLRLYGIRVNAP